MKKCFYYFKSDQNHMEAAKNDSFFKNDKKHDEKHDCKADKKKDAKLVGFAYDVADPIINLPLPNNFRLNPQPSTVAAATLDCVKKGDSVWLNALFHVNNNSATPVDLVTRIYRGSIAPSNIIYQSIVEIDSEGNDDATSAVAQFVDVLPNDEENVTYFLTAQLTIPGGALFVYGPITFTVAHIKQ